MKVEKGAKNNPSRFLGRGAFTKMTGQTAEKADARCKLAVEFTSCRCGQIDKCQQIRLFLAGLV